jgi:SPP1 family predicted phage head-tail adaptor
MPPIGQLRKRIELQAPTDTVDSYGQPTRAWATYATVWAQVEPTGGAEGSVANEQQITATHTVTIRYLAGVESTHRALYGARALHFLAPPTNVEERGQWLVIQAEERKEA